MEEEFNLVNDNLNNIIITINKILINIYNTRNDIQELITNYYNEILAIDDTRDYNLEYPYYGIKDEIIYRYIIVNKLGELLKKFSKIKYQNKQLNDIYLRLLNAERELYITYGKIFFEPLAWNDWLNFVNEKLTLRKELYYTLILAIRISQDEYPDETINEFYELETLDINKKYEILDFVAEFHIEHDYIREFLITNVVNNFIDVIYNR